MDRFREMEIFVAVATLGGFAKAGAALRISPPAVTRAVSGLEDRLGARLFQRTTRSLSLTEAGLRFLESARRLLAEVEDAEKTAVGETSVVQGHLVLTAPELFGRLILAPVLRDFLAAHPRVTAAAFLYDRVVNLVEEGIDLGVRIGALPDSSLIARRVGEVRRMLVASPGYLSSRGAPETPGDLKMHNMIVVTGLMPNREWRYQDEGRSKQVSLSPLLETNDGALAIAAAEAGEGIANVVSYMVAEQLREGQLLPVLDAFGPPPVPVQLVYPQSRQLASKVRGFLDFAPPRLAARIGPRGDHAAIGQA